MVERDLVHCPHNLHINYCAGFHTDGVEGHPLRELRLLFFLSRIHVLSKFK